LSYLLEVQKLWVSYGKALILEDVNLGVQNQELVAVIGPNGAGKTTLLRAISKLTKPSGAIFFEGKRIDPLSPVAIVKLGIIHCPEGRQLFPELSVLENLELGAYLRKSRGDIEGDLEKIFSLFPILKERTNQMAGTLSGGQQQMLAIGRSLMSRPKLLMLDEPSMGLSIAVKRVIAETVRNIRESGVTILLIEQDAGLAFQMADRVYALEHGKIALEGFPENLMKDPHVKEIYLGLT
jgi:branched-chain amino acid transport system ATP-binding protein